MKKKIIAAVILMMTCMMFCVSCGKDNDNSAISSDDGNENIDETGSTDDHSADETGNADESAADETDTAENIFADMTSTFIFASGAGAWGTTLDVNADGTFSGRYHDSDMGDTRYPNGVCYVCDFDGKFSTPVKIDEYTYSTTIEEMHTEKEEGIVEDVDGIGYIYSGPYGLENTEEIIIYLPGTPQDQIPQDVWNWALGTWYFDEKGIPEPKDLPENVWAIYNVHEGTAFFCE